MFTKSIVALITPFQQGSVDKAALKTLIEWHKDNATSGILACGTTAESLLLSPVERKSILDTVIAHAGDMTVIAGCGAPSTQETIHLVHEAHAQGAQAALIVVPYYLKPTQAELIEHYAQIHNHTHLPLILYNNPARCAVDMDVATITKLADLPRVVGIKDSNTDLRRLTLIRQNLSNKNRKDFVLLSGDDVTSAAYLLHGGDGIISVTANVAPDLCAKICELANNAINSNVPLSTFQKIANDLMDLNTALSFDGNPRAIKYALSLLGLCQNELRAPLQPVTNDKGIAIKAIISKLGLDHNAIVEKNN